MATATPLSPAARRAWDGSLLARFPPRAAQVLAADARERRVESGDFLFRGPADEDTTPVFLVVDGLARTYVRSSASREMTIRYVAEGELVGVPGLISGRSNPNVAVKVLTDSTVLSLPADRLAYLASTDVGVAWPIAQYLAEIHHGAERLWNRAVFEDMRARVAYHLLELSTRDEGGLVVRATQDEIANAVGSVREVVARALKGLGDDGLIRRGARGIRLTDPAGLHRLAS